jgi:hypothetical protein
MERIALEHFVDFMLTVGPARIACVKGCKDHRYDHLTDFYGPLREAILALHQVGSAATSLDAFLVTLQDERKARIFPGLVSRYQSFLASQSVRWFVPPSALLPVGDLEIEVKPELGVEIGGVPHILTMHFRGDLLAHKRVNLVVGALTSAFGAARSDTRFGVLDVPRACVRTVKSALNPKLGLLMRGEAAAFFTIYCAV